MFHKHAFIQSDVPEVMYCFCGETKSLHQHQWVRYREIEDKYGVTRGMVLQCKKCYEERNKLLFIAKDGWPIEKFSGRPITTFLRRLIHTRKITTYGNWLRKGGALIKF